jgi:hypothetical protein
MEGIKEDVAILKSQHKPDTMSSKISASVATLALIVSLSIFCITSCKEQINEKNGRRPSVINNHRSK